MYTRWRLYILAVFIIEIALCVLIIRYLNKKGLNLSLFRSIMLVTGIVLVTETIIVSTLSNFNLGVILPAIIGLPLIILAFTLPFMKQGFPLFLKRLALCLYILAGIVFRICGILMIRAQSKPDKMKCDAIIVLGAAVHGDKVTWVLENRLNTAKEYLDLHPECICIVSGGQGNGESVTEASAMKKYLINLGIDQSRICLEEKATNTRENFLYSKKIIDETIGENAVIGFVTTDFHVYRAGKTAKANGIEAIGMAAPDVWYLRLNNFLRESVGIVGYTILGKI